ncbi:MAG: class I SAM-dependent methyltransferase [Sphingobacteriales bacterium]|nr:MAG: class I SAM-dependent methyltransferase [Sphingobacteriales bacterium]
MEDPSEYLNVNKQSWNNRTASHLKSEFYDVKGFLDGISSLNSIELGLLGNVSGKSILHLQCHFGLDTISLARLGAKVTGVDLSDSAIEAAKELAVKAGVDVAFICCDVYDLPDHLAEEFDIVFTSYGVIGWLPDLGKWAKIISNFLKPGGTFVFAEFHPVVWMFDNNFKEVAYNYFKDEPIIEKESGTYADRQAELELTTITWNHSIAEVLTSLFENSIAVKHFYEFDYSPYNCFSNTVEFEPGKFRISHLKNYIPMVYALKANKSL